MSTETQAVGAAKRQGAETSTTSEESDCCGGAEQESCCDQSAKAGCCGRPAGGGCGCR